MKYGIRCANGLDAIRILENLREEEKREIRKFGDTPENAVYRSFAFSDIVVVLTSDDAAIMMAGVMDSLIGVPKVWALGTPACHKCGRLVLKWGKTVMQSFLKQYGKLENWCDSDFTSSIKWLRKIGFTVDDPVGGFCHLHAEV